MVIDKDTAEQIGLGIGTVGGTCIRGNQSRFDFDCAEDSLDQILCRSIGEAKDGEIFAGNDDVDLADSFPSASMTWPVPIS
jgi:hypothetical protein